MPREASQSKPQIHLSHLSQKKSPGDSAAHHLARHKIQSRVHWIPSVPTDINAS